VVLKIELIFKLGGQADFRMAFPKIGGKNVQISISYLAFC
jgi:hypothetical protein